MNLIVATALEYTLIERYMIIIIWPDHLSSLNPKFWKLSIQLEI